MHSLVPDDLAFYYLLPHDFNLPGFFNNLFRRSFTSGNVSKLQSLDCSYVRLHIEYHDRRSFLDDLLQADLR